MKVNHFVCPNCGHDFYVSAAYGTCDACQCMFYASQSQTCRLNLRTVPEIKSQITVNGIPIEQWFHHPVNAGV